MCIRWMAGTASHKSGRCRDKSTLSIHTCNTNNSTQTQQPPHPHMVPRQPHRQTKDDHMTTHTSQAQLTPKAKTPKVHNITTVRTIYFLFMEKCRDPSEIRKQCKINLRIFPTHQTIQSHTMSTVHSQSLFMALTVISVNIEGPTASKASILSEMCKRERCQCLYLQETHRPAYLPMPNIAGMSLVAERPHKRYHHHRFTVRLPIGLDLPLITLPFQGC